jgi:hypothetical protein
MPHVDIVVNGEKYPSVTQIVGILDKSFLAYWRGKIGNVEADRISRESAQYGRDAHQQVEDFLKGKEIQNPLPAFISWQTWWGGRNDRAVAQEIKVISKKYKYGGTFDCIISDGKQDILIDWKFSNNDDHYRYLQLAGYAQAYYEERGVKIKKGFIVRVDRDGNVHETHIENLWKFVPIFIMCRKIFDFVKKKGAFERCFSQKKKK